MKIIFSRKGFDSGYGGVPSPVLPGIGPVSLPIPSEAGASASSYAPAGVPLSDLLSNLAPGSIHEGKLFHYDPDLERADRRRGEGWRPALGQVGRAQKHLSNQGVGIGDLFLFFGWFRPAELYENRWRFVPGTASFHALYGWLQIGERIDVPSHDASHAPEWLADHPHVAHAARFAGQGNTVYVGADELRLRAKNGGDGGGRFKGWSEALRLSAEGRNRSIWKVPDWLEPRQGRKPLSFHENPDRWSKEDGCLYLQTVARGQEFVLGCDEYPEAMDWASALIDRHGSTGNLEGVGSS